MHKSMANTRIAQKESVDITYSMLKKIYCDNSCKEQRQTASHNEPTIILGGT